MKYISIVILLIAFMACEKEKSQTEKDNEIIKNYLSENDLEAELHYTGLYFHIIEEGSGGNPEITDTVLVRYKGYLTNNQVFDETTGDETFEYPLINLILGWQIGLPLIQKGGKEILYIPSILGYGTYSTPSIPSNSVLIFEIELLDFY